MAALPFQNMSGDTEQEYFCDGMVEEIIIALPASDGYSSWHLQGTSGRCEAGRVRACRAIRA